MGSAGAAVEPRESPATGTSPPGDAVSPSVECSECHVVVRMTDGSPPDTRIWSDGMCPACASRAGSLALEGLSDDEADAKVLEAYRADPSAPPKQIAFRFGITSARSRRVRDRAVERGLIPAAEERRPSAATAQQRASKRAALAAQIEGDARVARRLAAGSETGEFDKHEFAAAVGKAGPAGLKRLRDLREAGLVTMERRGRGGRAYYRPR